MTAITVTFVEEDGNRHEISDAPLGMSLMELARTRGVDGILGDCGGVCACATCHVYIAANWTEIVGPPDEIESEMLDMVADVMREGSRLSCQIKVAPELDGLEVTVAPNG
jgi:2Fe-2S ferredoxin